MAAAKYFRLAAAQADAIWEEVARAAVGWRAVARGLGRRQRRPAVCRAGIRRIDHALRISAGNAARAENRFGLS